MWSVGVPELSIKFDLEKDTSTLNVIEELTMDEYISLVMANKVKKDKTYRIIKLQKGEI